MKNKYLMLTIFVIIIGLAASVAIVLPTLDKVHDGNGDFSSILLNCIISLVVVSVCLIIGAILIVNGDRDLFGAVSDNGISPSIMGIYSAIYRVDLQGNKLQEVKSNANFEGRIKNDVETASKQLALFMGEIASKEYKDELLDFVSLDTLPERMKSMRTLSYEFVGENLGWCRIRFIAEGNDLEDISHVLCALEVIDKEKRREKELTTLAEMDEMTGIRNGKSGRKYIEKNLNSGNAGMLLLANIDKMTSINESFGNEVGDKTIIEVAKSLSNVFRDKDVIVRLGGDEFAVYIVGVTDEATGRVAIDRFFSGINSIDIPELKGRAISLSAGAAFYDGTGRISFDDIYDKVYNMVHQSKQISGNYCSYYRSSI